MSYLSGQYLLSPAGPNSRFALSWVAFFVLMPMIATTYAYWVQQTNHRLAPISRMARRVRDIAWTVAVVGLIIVGVRAGDAQLPLVQSRIVVYLLGLCFLALAAYAIYYVRTVVPEREKLHEQALLRQRYVRTRRRR